MNPGDKSTEDRSGSITIQSDVRAMYADKLSEPTMSLTQMLDTVDALRDDCEAMACWTVGPAADELAMRHDTLNVTITMANLHAAGDKAKREAILAKALRSRLPLGVVARRIVETRRAFDKPRGTRTFWRTRPHEQLGFEIGSFLLRNEGSMAVASTESPEPSSVSAIIHELEEAFTHMAIMHEAKDDLEMACQEHCQQLKTALYLTLASNLGEAVAKVGFLAEFWREAHLRNARIYVVSEIAIRVELDRWHEPDSLSSAWSLQ